MSKKHTIDHVRKYYESESYLYLSTTYTNSKTKELVQCPEGHQYEVSFGDFKNGRRCPVCSGKKKLTIEYVRKYYESFGYLYLSTTYTSARTKELVQCPEGHQYEVRFNNFQNGQRCPICANEIRSEKLRASLEYIRNYFKDINYLYLSTTYTNSYTKELVQCPKGHQYEVRFNHFQKGRRCPVCTRKKKHTIDHVRKYYESESYLYLSTTYTNSKTKELVQCPKGHQYEVSFNSFKNSNRRCPICNNEKTSSKAEVEIQEFVKTLTNTVVICNDRSQILNPETGWFLELDIYLPDLKKAIEYNGTYWHSSKEAKIRDQMKIKQCKNLNIDLLIINEADYINNNKEILSKIKNFIGL